MQPVGTLFNDSTQTQLFEMWHKWLRMTSLITLSRETISVCSTNYNMMSDDLRLKAVRLLTRDYKTERKMLYNLRCTL